jgi:hypothetical protein
MTPKEHAIQVAAEAGLKVHKAWRCGCTFDKAGNRITLCDQHYSEQQRGALNTNKHKHGGKPWSKYRAKRGG